ncbi:MAG: glutathione S-transferase family protein [Proteobacteria bacterium]|nr:glutathione S-transferase family protein [Pseudomonadota bacterium]
MADFTLVIGNRSSSSWSLRGWLALKQTGVDFNEERVWFKRPDIREQILAHSPSGLVPVLKHQGPGEDDVVWETLSIIEYLAELYPDAVLWPTDFAARTHARTVSAEMHGGFSALRNHMPMDLQNDLSGQGPGDNMGEGVAENIKRVSDIWEDCRNRFGAGGDFLFGVGFCAADIMFAPVVTRFQTYGVELSPVCRAYADAVLATPLMREWYQGAQAEPPPGEVPAGQPQA